MKYRNLLYLFIILFGVTELGYAQNGLDAGKGFELFQSYDSSNFESVNLSNGNLYVHVPIISYPQKGTLGDFGLTAVYNDPGYINVEYCSDDYGCWDDYHLAVETGESPGVHIVSSVPYRDPYYTGEGWCFPSPSIKDGSGASHPMAMAGSGPGSPWAMTARDGSGYRVNFSSQTSNGYPYSSTCTTSYMPSGTMTLLDPHGNATVGDYGAQTMTDPHGNTISFALNTTTNKLTYTDSFDRQIPIPSVPTSAGCQTLQYPGPPGSTDGTVPIEYCYASYTGGYLLHTITLPNGQSWTFDYNDYSDLTKITTPTGGSVSYAWDWGFSWWDGDTTFYQRAVQNKTIDANDGQGGKEWTYTFVWHTDTDGNLTDTVADPDGNYTVHTFPVATYPYIVPGFLCETEAQYYDSASTLLKTVDTEYYGCGLDQHLPYSTTTTWPTGQVKQSTTTYNSVATWGEIWHGYGYWPYFYITISHSGVYYADEVTETDEYDYSSGSPGSLVRKTITQYQPDVDSNYQTHNFLDRVASVVVKDGSNNQKAKTTNSFDESSYSSCSSSSPCGDLTTTNRYTDASSYVTTHTHYNSTGMPTSTLDANGNTTSISYDSTGGFIHEIEDALSHTEDFDYDSHTGVLNSHTDQNGQETDYSYDGMRRPISASLPDGGEQTLCYTDEGSNDHGGSTCSLASGPPYQFVFTKKITSSANFVQTGTVDGLGREIQTRTTVPSTTCSSVYSYVDTTYDSEGRKFTVSNPSCSSSSSNPKTATYYDALGRPCTIVPPDGTSITGTTCPSSQPTNDVFITYSGSCTTVTDQAGNKRQSCTDGLGRMTKVLEPDPTTNATLLYETDYNYDTLDNLLTVNQQGHDSSSSNWRTRTFTYDQLSRLFSSNNPEMGTTSHPEYGTITYTYDSNGNLVTKLAPQPNQTSSATTTTSYCYDVLNRLIKKQYAASSTCASPDLTYTYDVSSLTCPSGMTCVNVGQRTAMTDSAGSEAWTHYIVGTTSRTGTGVIDQRTTNSQTKSFTDTYNYDGSMASLAYPSGRTIAYGVNIAEQATAAQDITNSIDYAITALYTAGGALSSLSNGSSLLSTFYYNSRLQPCRIAINSSGTAPNACDDATSGHGGNVLDFTYDFALGTADNGNLKKITNNITSGRSWNYTYDTLNRIKTAYTDATTGTNCHGETFTIDPWSNLTGIADVTSPDRTGSGCTRENLSASAPNNQLSTLSYDSAGNGRYDGTNHYYYDAENRICAEGASDPTSCTTGAVNYTYDGDGKRVKKSSGTLYWYGKNSDPLLETDASGNLTYEYIFFGGKRIARRDSSTNIAYYFADQLGTARVVTNASGSVLDDCDYYPYGGEVSSCTTSGNHYKFTGKERDSESGLDNFGARYDSSQYGRFMSTDPSGLGVKRTNPQSWNRYSYSLNNPVANVDPNGAWTTSDHEDIIDKALRAKLSADDLATLKYASIMMDQDQTPGGANAHGMAFPGQDPFDASQEAGRIVTENLNTAVRIQLDHEACSCGGGVNSPEALTYFGYAFHTVADVQSPEHAGYQTWHGMGANPGNWVNDIRAATHYGTEMTSGQGFGSGEHAKAQAVYEGQVLWAEYQAMLEAARKKEEEKKKREQCKEDPRSDCIE